MSNAYIRSLKYTIETDRIQITTLCEHRDILLAALEALESVQGGGAWDDQSYCPWCLEISADGHEPDCQRQAAIAKVRDEWL